MNISRYFKESFTELVHKVTWPTWTELQNSATVVLIASIIIAITVAFMDYAFENVMEFVYRLIY